MRSALTMVWKCSLFAAVGWLVIGSTAIVADTCSALGDGECYAGCSISCDENQEAVCVNGAAWSLDTNGQIVCGTTGLCYCR